MEITTLILLNIIQSVVLCFTLVLTIFKIQEEKKEVEDKQVYNMLNDIEKQIISLKNSFITIDTKISYDRFEGFFNAPSPNDQSWNLIKNLITQILWVKNTKYDKASFLTKSKYKYIVLSYFYRYFEDYRLNNQDEKADDEFLNLYNNISIMCSDF